MSDNWKHRGKGMLCKSCMYFVEKAAVITGSVTAVDDTSKKVIGRCRRHAPTMNGFPVVFATDWCGDHKLDEGKI